MTLPYADWLASLMVGDEVILEGFNHGGERLYTARRVEAITYIDGQRRIIVNGIAYDGTTGRIPGSRYCLEQPS